MPEHDLDARVRRARHDVTTAVGVEARPPAIAELRRRQARRRGAGALAGAAAAAVVLVVAVAGARGGTDEGLEVGPADEAPSAPTTAVPGTGTANADLLEEGEARALAPGPLAGRSDVAAVWTGTEVVIWGGFVGEDGPAADGAAYDPRRRTWRVLAPGPLVARSSPAAVWTGTEVVIWGGYGDTGGSSTIISEGTGEAHDPSARADGAAYDPVRDTWRPIAEAPIAGGSGQAVWTGTEVVVHGGTNSSGAAVYDPDADRWRSVPSPGRLVPPYPSMTWTGSELVVPLMDPSGEDPVGTLHAFDPATDRWRRIPGPALASNPPTVVWTGGELVVVTPDGSTTTVDPGTGERTPHDPAPAGIGAGTPIVATGDGLVAWQPGVAAAFDPSDGSWVDTPAGPLATEQEPFRSNGAAVWADGVLVTWGGFPGEDDGVVLRPNRRR